MSNIQAILFDFDGVILKDADNDPSLELVDNITKTLQELDGVKKAICSNNEIDDIKTKIEKIEFSKYFDVLVGAGKNPKPNPEVYLKGAFALKCDPYRCLAVDDSITGLKAAIASGAISVGYAPTKQAQEKLETLMPDFIINDIYELVELYKNLNES
jgi:beta-phosphoglucomutase-like phosphatase (HAD superfamily)